MANSCIYIYSCCDLLKVSFYKYIYIFFEFGLSYSFIN